MPVGVKIVLFIGLVILVVVVLIYRTMERSRPQNKFETLGRESFSESRQWMTESDVNEIFQNDSEAMLKEARKVPVENLEMLARQVIDQTERIEEALYVYNQQHGITSHKATLLEIAVSYVDDNSTDFYIKNEDGSLVTITWNPHTKEIFASECIYTLDEILDAVWQWDGEPGQNYGAE